LSVVDIAQLALPWTSEFSAVRGSNALLPNDFGEDLLHTVIQLLPFVTGTKIIDPTVCK